MIGWVKLRIDSLGDRIVSLFINNKQGKFNHGNELSKSQSKKYRNS